MKRTFKEYFENEEELKEIEGQIDLKNQNQMKAFASLFNVLVQAQEHKELHSFLRTLTVAVDGSSRNIFFLRGSKVSYDVTALLSLTVPRITSLIKRIESQINSITKKK